MKRYFIAALCVVVAYLFILGSFTRAMEQKSYVVRLGVIPHPKVLQIILPDFQEFLGAGILSRVIVYYGTLVEDIAGSDRSQRSVDYPAMSRAVHAALRLDPYNMDGYYFGQAILAWDAHQYQLATELLEYGMKYRTWDWQLPFFAAFNQAYFLKDRAAAAPLYMRAGELSGSDLLTSLAGRYLQETGETQMAIDYLQTLEQSASTPAVKKSLQIRILAFKGAVAIEKARDRYVKQYGSLPVSVSDLIKTGFLESRPVDPYGGKFYLKSDGRVVTTSKFSFAGLRRSAEEQKVPSSVK